MITRSLIFTLLILSLGLAPARPAQAELEPLSALAPGAIYPSGRNCGGTSLAGGFAALSSPALAEVGGTGWQIGGPIDPVAGVNAQIRPSLAVSPAGATFFAWQEQRSGDNGDIFVANLAAAGPGRRGVRVDDSGAPGTRQASPAMAIDASGVIHAVWQDQRAANQALYYASSTDGGASWSANSLIPPTNNRFTHSDPALVSDDQGVLYLVWLASSATSEIRYSRYSDGVWSDSVTISSAAGLGGRAMPRLILDGAGGLVAAWEDRRSGTLQIYTARLADRTGLAWGADGPASPAGVSAASPSVAAAAGQIYIAYQGDPGIYMISSADSGASWGLPRRVDDGDGNAFTNPQLAVDSNGGIHCIWCRLRVNVVADIVAARSVDKGASWAAPVLLASTTGTADPLALVADRAGRVYAAWTDDGSGANQLHSALWVDERQLYLPLIIADR